MLFILSFETFLCDNSSEMKIEDVLKNLSHFLG